MSDEVLVVGATGTVGGEVMRATLARGGKVRALVRSARQLPHGVTPIVGDLRDDRALARALEGVSAALYVSPHETDEEALADRFVQAARHTRLVFVGVHLDGANRVSRALRRAFFGVLAGHYKPKFRISERVRTGHPESVVLMPTNYFQNDELFFDELFAGEYVQPFAKPVNRVDVRDLAEIAARALLDRSIAPGAHPVVGPASSSGAGCAEVWSRALDRPIRYVGDDDTRWKATLTRTLSGKKRDDFVATYGLLKNFALPTLQKDLEATTRLLGRAPRSFEAYVHDTLRARTARAA